MVSPSETPEQHGKRPEPETQPEPQKDAKTDIECPGPETALSAGGNGTPMKIAPVPVVKGPLWELEEKRTRILEDVISETESEFTKAPIDVLVGEAMYNERQRLRRFKPLHPGSLFMLQRHVRDRKLWKRVYGEMLLPPAKADRQATMRAILHHYSDEIGGHFDANVYRLATRLVPWGFSWLLNAASARTFMPWKMTASLQDRIRVLGEVDHLKHLAKKGTILLVPTHQSNIDSVLIGYIIYLMGLPPFAYGAGLNLFTNPVLSFFMSNLGAYTVDRQKSNELYKHVLKNYSTRILREGMHSIFFPGGGRSRSGAVEHKLKLGLLGTGLRAQLENFRDGKPNPDVYVVPMVMSYHWVLEAPSLIEQYLESLGKYRYMGPDVEGTGPLYKTMQFFWKFFSSPSRVEVRIGKPLDIFGNFVDENGRSLGPNGTTIDPMSWLVTAGELKPDDQRDREYTRELGERLVDRFHCENTVLTSHLAAFSFFMALRKKYPELDLFRFLRLSKAQRSLPYATFMEEAARCHAAVMAAHQAGRLHLSDELLTQNHDEWVRDGVKYLGFLHESPVLRIEDGVVTTGDMNLLYYYRNRLTGYGLSLLGNAGPRPLMAGEHDEQGFLA